MVDSEQRGLDDVIIGTSTISHVDGEEGLLWYRGHPVDEVVRHLGYEGVVHLLLWGERGHQDPPEELVIRLAELRGLTVPEATLIDALPAETPPMDALRAGLAGLGARGFGYPPTETDVLTLIAVLPTVLTRFWRRAHGEPIVAPDPKLDHVTNYLTMLRGTPPSARAAGALESYFDLLADHGMNPSTFTLRIVLSTNSTLPAAESAAMSTLQGPLHGGAMDRVITMLDKIHDPDHAARWVREALDRKERLFGFGHRVYKVDDPRAEMLREIASHAADPKRFELAKAVEDVALEELARRRPQQRLRTNVEFYAAVVLEAAGIPPPLFVPTFALARTVGWGTHAIEQAATNRLMRPELEYVGPPLQQFPPEFPRRTPWEARPRP